MPQSKEGKLSRALVGLCRKLGFLEESCLGQPWITQPCQTEAYKQRWKQHVWPAADGIVWDLFHLFRRFRNLYINIETSNLTRNFELCLFIFQNMSEDIWHLSALPLWSPNFTHLLDMFVCFLVYKTLQKRGGTSFSPLLQSHNMLLLDLLSTSFKQKLVSRSISESHKCRKLLLPRGNLKREVKSKRQEPFFEAESKFRVFWMYESLGAVWHDGNLNKFGDSLW